jgi:peptidoglycan/xylan/chitin deacetylase (PgdA/CDA1 family)
MSRRYVIAVIVAVVSVITAGTMATIAAVAARAGFAMPARVWIWIAIALDALFIYAVFERRSPVWGRIVSRGRPHTPAIAITFDDGPTEPYTSQILDVLRRFGAVPRSSSSAARAGTPDVVRRAAREGHEIGNHTWDHARCRCARPPRCA